MNFLDENGLGRLWAQIILKLNSKVPDGGTTGQVLKKTETGTEWADESGAAEAVQSNLDTHVNNTTIHVTAEEKSTWNAKADAPFKPEGKSYLTFSSPSSFTLAVNDAMKHWDGTLEYFASDKTWTVWNGTTTLSSVNNDGEHFLYLRGIGNTVMGCFDEINHEPTPWVINGTNVRCDGNIENLLDYSTVEAGQHPTMAGYCFAYLFSGCTALTQAPALPATTLADNCYDCMFQGCTSITQAPALPATTLSNSCYRYMFYGCVSLTQAPALPATTLTNYCYYGMFYGCTSLKLSYTKDGEYMVAYRIPTSGTGTSETYAVTNMFRYTGGKFTGTPSINTTYYLSSDNIVVTLTAAGWDADVKTQTVRVAGVTATSNGSMRIAQSATDDQFIAWGAAQPRVTEQVDGSITVKLVGTVPTIDIPVEVLIV